MHAFLPFGEGMNIGFAEVSEALTIEEMCRGQARAVYNNAFCRACYGSLSCMAVYKNSRKI
jgi:hypothetical protein